VVLARLICFIPSESNQHLTSAELQHGFDMPKSHIPITPFIRTYLHHCSGLATLYIRHIEFSPLFWDKVISVEIKIPERGKKIGHDTLRKDSTRLLIQLEAFVLERFVLRGLIFALSTSFSFANASRAAVTV